MLDHDPSGKNGPSKPLPDRVIISEPKDVDIILTQPISETIAQGGAAVVSENLAQPMQMAQ